MGPPSGKGSTAILLVGPGTLEQGLGLQRTQLETAEVQRQKKSPGLPAGEPRRHSEPESAPAVPSRGDRTSTDLRTD